MTKSYTPKSSFRRREVQVPSGTVFTVTEIGSTDVSQEERDAVMLLALAQINKTRSREPFVIDFPINARGRKKGKKKK